MYVYIYTYIHINIYVYMHTYIDMYIYIYNVLLVSIIQGSCLHTCAGVHSKNLWPARMNMHTYTHKDIRIANTIVLCSLPSYENRAYVHESKRTI